MSSASKTENYRIKIMFGAQTRTKRTPVGGAKTPVVPPLDPRLVASLFFYYVDEHHLQCQSNPASRIKVLVDGKSKYPEKA